MFWNIYEIWRTVKECWSYTINVIKNNLRYGGTKNDFFFEECSSRNFVAQTSWVQIMIKKENFK